MKRACPCLAGAAALALALVAVATPSPVRAGPNPLNDPLERDHSSPYAHSAIGAVVDANRGNVPKTGEELVRVLATLGDFVQLPVTFSSVALDSGLTHPRVVITRRPASHPESHLEAGGWGGPRLVTPPGDLLNKIEPNHTQLEGRLFLAANMEPDSRGRARVRTVEFISWNTRKRKFDFGVIEGMHTSAPELKVLDGVRCFSCHKNRGPILGVAPWSNTTHNEIVHDATSVGQLKDFWAKGHLPPTDGMTFFDPHASDVDAAVRQGADLLRDRAVFKQLAATAEGRKALVLLLGAIVTSGTTAEHDKRLKKELDGRALLPFVRVAQGVRNAALPSELRDFNPAVSVPRGLYPQHEEVDPITRLDWARAAGEARLPPAFVPSNPKAFVQFPPKPVRQVSDAISAALLARTIGLSEPDRTFLIDILDETTQRLNHRTLTRPDVVNLIFNGPLFADLMTTGDLPDRDDFKDRFVAGASALLKARQRDDVLPVRDSYTSAPKIDPGAKPEAEAPALPSHACLGCHDVRTAGRQTFSPIPLLAFDPFDATARDAWLKTADRKRKTEVLGRMLKRIGTDKDMPPEDSVEAELYRQKNPTGLAAVRSWLDAELKKVR